MECFRSRLECVLYILQRMVRRLLNILIERLTTVRILPSHQVGAPPEGLHHIANSSEHAYPTCPAFDVLAQPTKRRKLDSAIRLWTSINPFQVEWTLQVLIEPRERTIRPVAQKALELRPIPREFGRPRRRRGRRLAPT